MCKFDVLQCRYHVLQAFTEDFCWGWGKMLHVGSCPLGGSGGIIDALGLILGLEISCKVS